MIKLIGTNHLMKREVIEGILRDENPDIIGIELCGLREKVILNSIVGANFKEDNSLLGKITKSIKSKADEQGLDYGSDMKAALSFAVKNKIPYVLVDMPIIKTQELFSKIPLNEQQGFANELTEFQNESINKKVDENEVISQMKLKYPIAFEFLINMRNLYISNQILLAEKNNPNKKIVVILGSAHVLNVKQMIGQ